jgi:ribonuclease T1
MRIHLRHLLLVFTLYLGICFSAFAGDAGQINVRDLPPEAKHTLRLIQQGGPFPYDKDGSVFGNYERLLPKRARGYYHEYTVKTPYARNRGARRIIAGGDRPPYYEFYYTDDHYASFKRIKD